MALLVQKYGGTSVGSIERIKSVAARVGKARDGGDRLVVVVSAMAGETNRLFRLAAELSEAPDARETDVLVATGDEVKEGQGIVVVEAMKMENELKSPKAGKVLEVKVVAGQTVEKGELMIVIE